MLVLGNSLFRFDPKFMTPNSVSRSLSILSGCIEYRSVALYIRLSHRQIFEIDTLDRLQYGIYIHIWYVIIS